MFLNDFKQETQFSADPFFLFFALFYFSIFRTPLNLKIKNIYNIQIKTNCPHFFEFFGHLGLYLIFANTLLDFYESGVCISNTFWDHRVSMS